MDKYDEQAQIIADCVLLRSGFLHPRLSNQIAAALREQGQEIERLRAERDEARTLNGLCNSTDFARSAQLVDLRAELHEREQYIQKLTQMITAIMGRCANLLDRDQFNNLEAIVDGVEPWFNDATESLAAEVDRVRAELASAQARIGVQVWPWGEKTSKSWYEPSQMRLLERLANQIGNDGTLFHELCSMFKDFNHQIANLRAELAKAKAERNELDKYKNTHEGVIVKHGGV